MSGDHKKIKKSSISMNYCMNETMASQSSPCDMIYFAIFALLTLPSLSFVFAIVSVDASADDRGPILNEVHVDEITSDEPTKLDELINREEEEKRKKDYSVCVN